MNFIGYTCNKDVENQRDKLKQALNNCFEDQEQMFPNRDGQIGATEVSGFSTGGGGDTSMITRQERGQLHQQNMDALTKQVFRQPEQSSMNNSGIGKVN